MTLRKLREEQLRFTISDVVQLTGITRHRINQLELIDEDNDRYLADSIKAKELYYLSYLYDTDIKKILNNDYAKIHVIGKELQDISKSQKRRVALAQK